MTTPDPLTEAVALEIAAHHGWDWKYTATQDRARHLATAALAIARPQIRREALEEAREAAWGPVYRTNPQTNEPALRGTDAGNWSVPQPIAGFKGSDYGTGRYSAGTAITDLMEKPDDPR